MGILTSWRAGVLSTQAVSEWQVRQRLGLQLIWSEENLLRVADTLFVTVTAAFANEAKPRNPNFTLSDVGDDAEFNR